MLTKLGIAAGCLGVVAAAGPLADATVLSPVGGASPATAGHVAAHHAARTATTTAATKPFTLHDIKHVFIIMVENEDYAKTFGSTKADPYLASTLPQAGLLLEDYYGTGHASNDNYVSITSGQAPNSLNQTDCQDYSNFASSATVPGEPDQQLGEGCVYPKTIGDIGNQLTAKHKTWKAYEQDMGNIPTREAAACGHPPLGAQDKTQTAQQGDGYVSRHDPFVYYHQVIDSASYCDKHVVALGSASGAMPKTALPGETGLATDLKSIKTTPHYSFITPNLCEDGHDYPCSNEKGGKSAVADIDTFLNVWVPKITSSPAFKKNGLLEITFDEADTSDATACCKEASDPNALTGGYAGLEGPGGGRIGALLISPFVKPGTKSTLPYNHYSTLATDEAIFGLPKLGYATKANTFATSLFTTAKHVVTLPPDTNATDIAQASGE